MRLTDPQHGLDGAATPGMGDGPVDVAEVVELHEAVEGELPCPIQRNQFRDKALRYGVALDYTKGLPSFRESGRAADAREESHSALRIQPSHGQSIHLRIAAGFHYIIDATPGDIRDAGGYVVMATVDCVSGAQLQGELEPHGDNIDADDRACTDDCELP